MNAPRVLAGRLASWLTAQDSPGPLAFFRVGLAGVALVLMAALWPSLLDVFGQYGFVQWAITRSNLDSYLPHIGNVALLLKPLGVSADQTVWGLAFLDVAVLAALAAGWHTRVCAIAAFVLDILFIHAAGGLLYGADIFIHIAFFYLVFMPSGDAFSLDVRAGRRVNRPSVTAGLTRRLLKLHLVIVYVSSGIEKGMGAQWWNGDAIWRSVVLPAFRRPAYLTIDLSSLAQVPWLPLASGWLVLLVETGYGVFIWGRRTRLVWLCLTLGMHLFIGVFLGMALFAAIMSLLNLAAFGPEALADIAAWRQRRASRAPASAAA
jgi:hypothetical protein